MTFVGALRHDGIIAPWVIDGPINGESFRTYVEQVLVPELRPGDIVVMDNLGSHKTWCDCGGRSPGANEVRYVGLMDISREENDLWNTMSVWMCR